MQLNKTYDTFCISSTSLVIYTPNSRSIIMREHDSFSGILICDSARFLLWNYVSHLGPGASRSCCLSCSQFPLGWPLAKYLGGGKFSLTALAQMLVTNSVSSTDLFNFDSQNRSGDSSQLPSFQELLLPPTAIFGSFTTPSGLRSVAASSGWPRRAKKIC